MCGIAGLITSPAKPLPISELSDRINAMQAALVHRGPDHQAIYLSASGNAAICHTRLAVIDISANANQPMTSEDGRYTLSFNGEIYNHKKLRVGIEERGAKFKSKSDSEVVLKLLIEKGTKGLKLLRGMFAIALWDEKKQSLLLARDPQGIKPLYYCVRKDTLGFASEVRALLKAQLSSGKLSSRGINQYLLRGSFSEPDTAFTDIKLLPAGTFFEWQEGRPKLQRYWKPSFKVNQSMTRERAIEVTRDNLEHSVKAHLVSDVPIGLFLSGGIASSALLAIATQLTSKKINTYSIAFEDKQWNEGQIEKRTAQHFGCKHTEWQINSTQAQDLFKDFLKCVDQPTTGGFNSYCVAKLASENGEKVMLSGLGADELFAGHSSFKKLPSFKSKAQNLKWLSFILAPCRDLIDRLSTEQGRRILDILYHPQSMPILHQSFRGIFSLSEARYLAQKLTGKESHASYHKLRAKNTLDQISELELSVYCRNQPLRESDIFSMTFGLELRVPFIDKVMIEQLLTIPKRWRLELDKKLLIDSVPELPKWILEHPKQEFRLPFDDWLKEELNTMPIKTNTENITLESWSRRWSLAALEDWLERHAS